LKSEIHSLPLLKFMSTQITKHNPIQQSTVLLPIIVSGIHIPPEIIDAIASFLKIEYQLIFIRTFKAIYSLYHRFSKIRIMQYNFGENVGSLHHSFCLEYAAIFQNDVNQNDWSTEIELKLVSVNSGKTSQYETMGLCLDETLNVPSGCENIIALILTFSSRSNYAPLPELFFFEQFPKLKFLVLQFVGLDKRAMVTISKMASQLFVYMHDCRTLEFGFGPFEDFESCENIRRLHLDGRSFGRKRISFPSNLIKLKVTNYYVFQIDASKCSNLEYM
jgi:hypothetical protein